MTPYEKLALMIGLGTLFAVFVIILIAMGGKDE
jgi:hypothetical protein